MSVVTEMRVLMAALIGAIVFGLGASPVQSASVWATRQGRWENWKSGAFSSSADHYAALKAAAVGASKLRRETISDWKGLWTAADSRAGVTLGWGAAGIALGWGVPHYSYTEEEGLRILLPAIPGQPPLPLNTPAPEEPVLTPAAEAALIRTLKLAAKGAEWDYIYNCLPAGFPRWFTEPYMREFIATPEQTWMINEFGSEVRRIYTDGRGHVPEDERYSLWEGDSIGFWDGDTLMIHTISLKPGTWNRGEPPYSDQTETVELVRKNASGMIEVRMTVYDPATLRKPWHVIFGSQKVDLKATPNIRINLYSCSENNNFVPSKDGGITSLLPSDPGYADPNTASTAAKVAGAIAE